MQDSNGEERAGAGERVPPTRPERRRRIAELVLWILLPLPILVGFVRTTRTLTRDDFRFDAASYAAMAEPDRRAPATEELFERAREERRLNVFSEEEQLALLARMPPFCWRVLTPWLASLLPLDTVSSFKRLAFLFTWGGLTLLCLFLRRCGLPVRTTVVGLLLYSSCYHAVEQSFLNPVYSDYMTQAFLIGGLYLIACGRHWALLPLVMLGMLQKESLLCLVPVALVHYGRDGGWRRRAFLAYAAFMVALPLAVLKILQWLIPPVHEFEQVASLWKLFSSAASDPGFWPRFGVWTVIGLGMALPLALLQAGACRRYLRANLHWAVLIAVGFVFLWAGTKSRLYLYMLPVVVLLGAWTTQPAIEGRGRVGWLWVLGTLALAFHLERLPIHKITMGRPPDDVVLGTLNGIGVLLLGWALISLWLERAGRLPSRHEPRGPAPGR